MDWQRDPKTGEWVVVDSMTQGMTGQEPDPSLRDPAPPYVNAGPTDTEAGYDTGDDGVYPVMSSPMAPSRTDEGAPVYHGTRVPPLVNRDAPGAGYQNIDYDAVDRWVQEVQARGNEIRTTAAGTFEVDAEGGIVSEMPVPQYRMN